MGSPLFDTEKRETLVGFETSLQLSYEIGGWILRSGTGKVKFKLFIVYIIPGYFSERCKSFFHAVRVIESLKIIASAISFMERLRCWLSRCNIT